MRYITYIGEALYRVESEGGLKGYCYKVYRLLGLKCVKSSRRAWQKAAAADGSGWCRENITRESRTGTFESTVSSERD